MGRRMLHPNKRRISVSLTMDPLTLEALLQIIDDFPKGEKPSVSRLAERALLKYYVQPSARGHGSFSSDGEVPLPIPCPESQDS